MKEVDDIQCPVCGYYCLGKGGIGCIDKPSMFNDEHLNLKPATTPIEAQMGKDLLQYIKRIGELQLAMQECVQLVQSIQNSRVGHSPHLVYCDRSFRKDKIDSLSEKLTKLLEKNDE